MPTLSLRSVAAIGAMLAAGSVAQAQSAAETVKMTLTAFQPSLFDNDARDTFQGVIDDRSATTTLNIECSAGASAWLGLSRVDEACSTAGSSRGSPRPCRCGTRWR